MQTLPLELSNNYKVRNFPRRIFACTYPKGHFSSSSPYNLGVSYLLSLLPRMIYCKSFSLLKWARSFETLHWRVQSPCLLPLIPSVRAVPQNHPVIYLSLPLWVQSGTEIYYTNAGHTSEHKRDPSHYSVTF